MKWDGCVSGLCQILRNGLFLICLGAHRPIALCFEPPPPSDINYETAVQSVSEFTRHCQMARRRPGRRQSWETGTATRSKMILTLNQMELHRREGKHKTGSGIPFSPGCFGPWEPKASLSRVGGGAPPGRFSVNLWAGGILEERLCLLPWPTFAF